MILETPEGDIDMSRVNELEIAVYVMSSLADKYDWVRLHSSGRQWHTQWTVLERNDKGFPLQIASQEFDGEMEVITCG